MAQRDAYAEYGGVLRFPPSSQHGLLHQIFNARARDKPDRPLAPHELPNGDIAVEFINNRTFNAVAFISESAEYVGINVGAFNAFGLFSCMLMNDPQTFPTIGNANLGSVFFPPDFEIYPALGDPSLAATAADLEAANRLLANPENFSAKGYRGPVPACPIRQGLMLRINYIAYSHLLIHEVGHIVKCHIPFLLGRCSHSQSYLELPSFPLSSEECRIRRALEFDADASAFHGGFRILKVAMEKNIFPELTAENYVEVWSAAITLLYRVMRFLSYIHGFTSPHSTHPSADARLRHGIILASSSTVPPFQSEALPSDRILNGMLEVNKWWLRAGLPTYGFDQGEMAIDEAIATLEDLEPMRPDLSKLAQERKRAISV